MRNNFDFVIRHVAPASPARASEWRVLWAAAQGDQLPRYVALVHFYVASRYSPGAAFRLLREAAGLAAMPHPLDREERNTVWCADPFRLAATYLELVRALPGHTGNEIGHLDRIAQVLGDAHQRAEQFRRERRDPRREEYVPVTFYHEPEEDTPGSWRLGFALLLGGFVGLAVLTFIGG